MQDSLKNWLTTTLCGHLKGAEKLEFLKVLRDEPEVIEKNVAADLPDLGLRATAELNEAIFSYGSRDDAKEFVAHLKEHYSKEISALAA